MVCTRILFLFFAANICISSSLKHLPSYIKPCHRDDPELGKCIKDHINAVIPYLVKGDPEYHFEPLDPLKIPEAIIDNEQGFRLKMTDISVYGFDTVNAKDVKMNFLALETNQEYVFEKFSIVSNYEAKGEILSRRISGNGKANITLIKPTFHLTWNLGTTIKEGIKYVILLKAASSYDLEGAVYKIDNLFNGNKELGEDMNRFLNENWKVLHDELGSTFARIVFKVIRDDALSIIDSIPLDEIFLQ